VKRNGDRRTVTIRTVAAASGALALALAVSGCSTRSPATTVEPHPPSDGVQVDVANPADGSAVKLRNFVVVADGTSGRGQVVGAVVNTGGSPVQLQLTAAGATAAGGQAQIEVPAAGLAQVGPGGTAVVLEQVPAPGRFLQMTAATGSGGTQSFAVPVVAATSQYADLAPPAATPSATP
jgi:hypothetical protein